LLIWWNLRFSIFYKLFLKPTTELYRNRIALVLMNVSQKLTPLFYLCQRGDRAKV